ncbi:MAG TPA: carbohydrate-binding family 9-like protein [Planctomycetota bacterium]|nr:carbohydrate-binding family 9-like protein [Planctomycetota bacterium]
MAERGRTAVVVLVLAAALGLCVPGCDSKPAPPPEVTPPAPSEPGAPPVAVVKRCAAAPAIDGDLGDACWKAARIAGVWIDPDTGGAADPHPGVFVCYDDKNLYVALHNPEPEMTNVIADVTERDGSVWDDDSDEVFLDPTAGEKTYFQFIVNTNGVLYDGQGKDRNWDSKAVVKVKKTADGWSAEFSIPLADLGVVGSPKGQTWTANFCRNRLGRAEPQRWSDTGDDEHNYEAFGKLKME